MPYSRAIVPDLLPAHLLKRFAVKFSEHPFLKPGGGDIMPVDGGRDAQGAGNGYAFPRQARQGCGFAAHCPCIIGINIVKG
jgi:hypothetical protein